MSRIRSSRDIILRTANWQQALHFYGKVLGFPTAHESETIVGFDTGAICLYVEKGEAHGPVLDFLAPEVQGTRDRLIEAGCELIEESPAVPRCYLRDPFGLVFNIGQASSAQ